MLVWRKPCSQYFALSIASSTLRQRTNGQERHHLLDRHERILFVGLAEQQFAFRAARCARHLGPARRRLCRGSSCRGHRACRAPSPACTIATDVSLSTSAALSRTAPARSMACIIASKTCATTKTSFSAMQSRLLSYDAALNDAPRGTIQVGRLVHHDRRIARSGHDRPFAAVERRAGHGRTARDTDQGHVAMLEDRGGRFQRRLGNHADQIVDAHVPMNRLVEPPDTFGGHAFAARDAD